MQQAPKLSMEQRVGALDRFYKLLDGTSQRLESLAIIEVIKGIENDIKELKAKEALAMSIKKVSQVAETMKTHKTDRINKCKDSNKFNIQIGGPRTCSKCKICGKLFTQRKTLNKHYKVKHEATDSLDQSELIKLKPLDLQLSDSQVKSKCADLQAQPRSIDTKVKEDIINFDLQNVHKARPKLSDSQAQSECADLRARLKILSAKELKRSTLRNQGPLPPPPKP